MICCPKYNSFVLNIQIHSNTCKLHTNVFITTTHNNIHHMNYRGGPQGQQQGSNQYYSSMQNRDALFGKRPNGGQDNYSEQMRHMLEEENNRNTAMLSESIGRLKELSIEINGEVNAQNEFLDGMQNSFGQAGSLMSGTMRKLQQMIDSGGSKHMCYLVMFIVGLFLFMYFFLSKR